MGNHDAGKAMGVAAEVWALTRPISARVSKEEASLVLDMICKPWKGCDAEFEAENQERYAFYTDFNAPLGRLIAAVFAPGQSFKLNKNARDEDPVWLEWEEMVLPGFKERYDFY